MPNQKTTKELLVALLPRVSALDILKTEGWYHIPVEKAPKRWPPKILAFYQGKVFGTEEAYKIRYFGEIYRIDTLARKELFPDDERNQAKAENLYYRLQLKTLEEREQPIISYRPRRLVFVPTTWDKFTLAGQINDLFDDSPLEDRMWYALKRTNLLAERQWKVNFEKHIYYLDFAVFCRNGNLAIETDGYTTHHESTSQIDYDTWRQNEIEIDDWRFLHYTSKQVQDERTPYLTQIQAEVAQLGGLESAEEFKRKIGEEPVEYLVDMMNTIWIEISID
jgi:very-short-patch-repair endonuclease